MKLCFLNKFNPILTPVIVWLNYSFLGKHTLCKSTLMTFKGLIFLSSLTCSLLCSLKATIKCRRLRHLSEINRLLPTWIIQVKKSTNEFKNSIFSFPNINRNPVCYIRFSLLVTFDHNCDTFDLLWNRKSVSFVPR